MNREAFDLEITFMDGTIEIVPKIHSTEVRDGKLSCFINADVTYFGRTWIASYPMANIRKYRRM